MHTITVFTPAYNRAHTLPRTYDSLINQTCQDFEWLIVDDGSTDGTSALVNDWITEGRIAIRYIYQDNQGMHCAHNTAYKNIFTELNTCIDSDDYMPSDAVERIVTFWKANGSDRYAGIVGLDYADSKGLIGSPFPDGLKETTLSGYYSRGGRGDKKLVYRTDVIRAYPEYPVFKGEKYFSLGYKYLLIDQDYMLLTLNENGFMFLRKEHMRLYPSVKKKFKSCVHYVSHSLRAGRSKDLFDNPYPVLTLMAILPGICLYFKTWYMVRYNRRMRII